MRGGATHCLSRGCDGLIETFTIHRNGETVRLPVPEVSGSLSKLVNLGFFAAGSPLFAHNGNDYAFKENIGLESSSRTNPLGDPKALQDESPGGATVAATAAPLSHACNVLVIVVLRCAPEQRNPGVPTTPCSERD